MNEWTITADAVQAAIARAAQLATDRVVWKYQNVDAPAYDYVALGFGSLLSIGIDYLTLTYDASRAPGQEYEQRVNGNREVSLEVECYTSQTTPQSSPFPDKGLNDSMAVAERIRASLLLPTVRAKMASVGVSPFDPGPVRNLPTIASAGFRGRAQFSIRCYMPIIKIVEYVGYIQHFNGTVGVSGGATGYSIPFSSG